MIPAVPANSRPAQRTLFGHPQGLYFLFFSEMWERMSYYGMRALLVLYMTDHLFAHPENGAKVFGLAALKQILEYFFGPLAAQPLSSQIYGLYTAFVYLTPFFGGILADRLLGQRKSVIWGAVLMAIGHFLMASESLFLVALFVLILGNGCFKPNISTQVGGLYPAGDPRRDGAFTIFYMGINLGAFMSPLICGTLGQKYGWHYGFAAAGVGMVLGLIIYLYGQRYLAPDQVTRVKIGQTRNEPLTRDNWKCVIALIILCALNIPFWAVYEQQGNTMQIWADKNTDWHLFGWEMPSTWFQAFNPAMIFIFAPILDRVWRWQARRRREPDSVLKMAIGCFLLGGSFLVMITAAAVNGDQQKGSVLWLVATTWILTMGELYLSPVGLSLVTKVAPARMVSMMMGVWFLSSFFGNYLEGYLGTFYSRMPKTHYFAMLLGIGLAAGVAIWLVQRPLKRAVEHKSK